jgi:nucleoid DNA-binding protein
MKINLQDELVKTLVEMFGFCNRDAKIVYRALLMSLMENLAQGNAIDMRGFGKFYISRRKPQTIKNRFTTQAPGGSVTVPARNSLRFVPSKGIKQILNKE